MRSRWLRAVSGAAALVGLCAGLSAPPALSASTPRWQFIGPRVLVPQCPVGNCQAAASYQMGGRVNGLLWQGGTLFAATAYGGVWRWNARAATWRNATPDGPALSTGALAPGTGGTVYVATGDSESDAGSGDGIVRLRPGQAPAVLAPSARVGGLRIFSPTDTGALVTWVRPGAPTAMLASDAYGVFRSTDGGRTWSASVATGYKGTEWGSRPTAKLPPLLQSPARPNVVYTDVGPALLRSDNFGRTWTRLSTQLPDWAASPYRASLALAQSPSDPAVLYASIQSVAAAGGGLVSREAIYQSLDGGAAWQTIFTGEGAALLQFPGYSNVLSVSPHDPRDLYVGLIALMEIQGAGAVNQAVVPDVMTSVDPFATVDIHALTWHDGALYVGGDQGVVKVAPGAATTVTAMDHGLGDILDYGGLAQYGGGGILLVGTQDNRMNVYVRSKRDNQLSAFPLRLTQYADLPLWTRVLVCGDGGAAAIDPADPARMWAACTRFVARAPFLVETTTGLWPGDSIAPPSGAGGLTEVTALHAEPNGSLWAGASNGVLYRLGADGAWRAMWRPSPPAWCARDGLDAVGAVTPGTSGSLWAIDGCGQVGLSTDGGASWRTLDPAGAPDLSRWPQGFADQGGLNAIWPDPASPGVAYLGYGTTGPHSVRQAVRWGRGAVCRFDAATGRCAPADGALPSVESLTGTAAGTLVAGTALGAWALAPGATRWQPYGAGLPPVSVTSLVWAGRGTLIAGTYGRGVWQLNAG